MKALVGTPKCNTVHSDPGQVLCQLASSPALRAACADKAKRRTPRLPRMKCGLMSEDKARAQPTLSGLLQIHLGVYEDALEVTALSRYEKLLMAEYTNHTLVS